MEEMLLHTDDPEAATAEIESVGGRVTIQLGDELLIAKVPKQFVSKKKSFTSASAHVAQSASQETLTYVQAYWMAREKKLQPEPPIQDWDDKTAPLVLPDEYPGFIEGENSPYRSTLTGKIAAGIIIVSGPGELAISNAEKNTVVSEVMAGLQFWEDQAPASANLKFQLHHYFSPITVTDSTSCTSHPACHNRFANAALKQLGYSTGKAGRDKLAQHIKDQSNADGAYLGYFSKYRQKHFAYAYNRGPLYMQYKNDGWGPNRIDRVFAHETGHVFYAPDEYGKCKCTTTHGRGGCSAKNSNCKNCPGETIACIMKSNSLSMCSYTRKHVGWC